MAIPFQQILFRPCRLLTPTGDTLRDVLPDPVHLQGKRCVMVPRALCRFRVFPLLKNVSPRQQKTALDLAIERWSPFAETGHCVHFGATQAAVWVWDREAITRVITHCGEDPDMLTILPETALQAASDDGLRLVKTLDGGVEGQVWQGGMPVAGRHWTTAPDDYGWLSFQRSAAVVEKTDKVPDAQPPVWLDRPWVRSRAALVSGTEAQQGLKAAAVVAGGLLLLGYAFTMARHVAFAVRIAQVEQNIVQVEDEASRILNVRNRVWQDLEVVEALLEKETTPPLPQVMARVAGILPRNGTRLVIWEQQGDRLSITLESPRRPDAAFLVGQFSQVPLFTDVTARPAGTDNTLRLDMTLVLTHGGDA